VKHELEISMKIHSNNNNNNNNNNSSTTEPKAKKPKTESKNKKEENSDQFSSSMKIVWPTVDFVVLEKKIKKIPQIFSRETASTAGNREGLYVPH
jgi:hypothetical protein